ncbi:MAG: MFS transporter [Ilumatobacter sp.]
MLVLRHDDQHQRSARRLGPRVNLGRLTAAKAVANTALRWAPPFLPVLERAFGATTAQLTTVLGLGEMAGLSTVAVGRLLDRGREQLVTVLALACISVASLIALVGTTTTFAVGFVLVVIGVSNCTVAGHSHISHRVSYAGRARAIGLYETSWAIALLVGAPIIAGLIAVVGWRGPFVALAAACAWMSVVIWRSTDTPRPTDDVDPSRALARLDPALQHDGARVIGDGAASSATPTHGLEPSAIAVRPVGGVRGLDVASWAVIIGSASLAVAGLSVFAISGSWLDDAFGVSTGGLGAVAMGFGAIELLGSTASAGLADRLGKLRSTLAGIALLIGGLAVMATAGSTLWIGVVGILLFLCGFEFAFVTSLSLVTEANPAERGTTIAVNSGVGTVARGCSTIASGALFTTYGIGGTLVLSGAGAVMSSIAFVVSRRVRA